MKDGPVLFVSNPLTKMWKELPRFLCKQRPMLVRMIMWKRPSHYKVIVVGVGSSTKIFDSVEGKWNNTGCSPCEEVGPRNLVFCNGRLYCLAKTSLLFVFNFEDKVWSYVMTSRLPGYPQFRNLVTCKGHIAIVSKSMRHKVTLVSVWLLEWRTMIWREAGRMPHSMSNHFLHCSPESLYCCSHNNMIFLISDVCAFQHSRKYILFDMAQNMWRWVEDWPNLLDSCSGLLTFEPRLDSQV